MTIPLTLRQVKGSPLEWSEVDNNFTALRDGIETVDLSGLTPRTSPTGAAVLPAGTTAERDSPPLPGYVRFNSTTNEFEGFDGTAWGALGGGASDPLGVNTITNAAGTGAPNFPNGLRLNTNAVLGPVTGDAPMYACRAWVNFDGTTTVPTIRASGNVSSVVRNGTGDYTVNFATAMPDANYAVCGSGREDDAGNTVNFSSGVSSSPQQTASSFRIILARNIATGAADSTQVNVAIFR